MKLPKIKFAVLLPVLTMAFALAAFATITPLTPVVPKGPYVVGQPGANSLNYAYTACDASNGNSFPATGRDLLLVRNTDTMAAHTFTVTSVADSLGRSQDVTAYSVAASAFSAYSFRGSTAGWAQSADNTVHLSCSTADIFFAVLTTSN